MLADLVKVFNLMRREDLAELVDTMRTAHAVRAQLEGEIRPALLVTARAGTFGAVFDGRCYMLNGTIGTIAHLWNLPIATICILFPSPSYSPHLSSILPSFCISHLHYKHNGADGGPRGI